MTVLTAQGIANVSIALLTRQLVLPRTVTPVPGAAFAGANGDTVTVRVPQPGTARTQASAGATITYDDVDEVPVDVTLSHLYHAKLVSDQELSLQLEDFARQITRIQTNAVATRAENLLATVMNGLASDLEVSADGSDFDAAVLEALEDLTRANVPMDGLWLAVSPEMRTFALAQDHMTKANEAGSPSALRNAIIGQYRGFNTVVSAGLSAGSAVAYHESGFAFANRVPVVPRGVTDSATANEGGIGMRQIFQYVPDKLSDASVVSTFAGASAVTDSDSGAETPRFVKLTTSGS
jgi:hypothetical protein